MRNDHYQQIAADKMKESRLLAPRVLLFALIVLMSHLLELKPSTVDAAGVKIAVKDAVVIRGGIALVFYYYFWNMVSSWMDGALLFPMSTPAHKYRNLLANYRRRIWNRKEGPLNPSKAKKYARSLLRAHMLSGLPFVLVRMYIVIIALVVAIPDLLKFGAYVYQQLPSE